MILILLFDEACERIHCAHCESLECDCHLIFDCYYLNGIDIFLTPSEGEENGRGPHEAIYQFFRLWLKPAL